MIPVLTSTLVLCCDASVSHLVFLTPFCFENERQRLFPPPAAQRQKAKKKGHIVLVSMRQETSSLNTMQLDLVTSQVWESLKQDTRYKIQDTCYKIQDTHGTARQTELMGWALCLVQLGQPIKT